MALLTIYSIPVCRRIQSTFLSRATFFCCFCFLLTTIPPILIAYSTDGLWVKQEIHREVPVVQFKDQVLMLMHSSSDPYPLTWSTFNEYNLLMSSYLIYPVITVRKINFIFREYQQNCALSLNIQSYETDENGDGLMDRLDLTLEFNTNQTINYFQLLLVFSYQLQVMALRFIIGLFNKESHGRYHFIDLIFNFAIFRKLRMYQWNRWLYSTIIQPYLSHTFPWSAI